MKPRPLVSVISTFFNSREFLPEAIESVLAQTYDTWEYILVDDGSSDGSSDIAHSFALRFPGQIRAVEHPRHKNCGISASEFRSTSRLRRAIATLDADDVWMPNKLERQVAVMSEHPDVAFVYGHTLFWYSWDSASKTEDKISSLHVPSGRLYVPPALFGPKIREEITTASMSSICFRREVIDRIGGPENSFRGMFEDQCFLAKVFLNETVFVSNECWDKYRQHAHSTVSRARVEGTWKSSHRAHVKWVAKYLNRQGRKRGPAWEAVQTVLQRYRHPSLVRLLTRWRMLNERFAGLGRRDYRGDLKKKEGTGEKLPGQ